MKESIEIIRFEIDGRWTAAEMAKSLIHLEDLYNLRFVLQVVHEDWHDWEHFYYELMHFPSFRRSLKRRMLHPALFAGLYPTIPTIPLEPRELSQISNLLYPQEQLEIRRIEYGSPGFKDLAGLGEIVGHIKDFVLAIIEHCSLRKKRNLENEERELKNEQLRIENAENSFN